MLTNFLSKYLKDRKGNKFYATSHVDAIYDRNGNILGDTLEELQNNSSGSSTGSGSDHSHSKKAWVDRSTGDKVTAWDNKVDKIDGMGWSRENFTTVEKERLQNLTNFDDTALSERIDNIEGEMQNLVTKEYVA